MASLRPGQTGCLTGRFAEYVHFDRSGRANARITLRAAPGQSATVCGHMWFRGAYWRLSRITVDGSCSTQDTIVIFGSHVTLDHDDITNRFRGKSCVVIGTHAWTEAVVDDTVLHHDRIHDCGAGMSGHTHAVYAAATRNARITDSYIHGIAGFSVQLYPDAQRTLVARNVIDGSMTRSGVVLAGESPYASSNNLVTHNIISRNALYGVFRSWAGPVGVGNLVEANCLWKNVRGAFPPNPTGLVLRRNIQANPRFVGQGPPDYRLRRGSPCSAMHPRGHVGP